MYFKTDFTPWKDPATNEFISRKEYGKLGKRATVNNMSTPDYLVSLGYLKDYYNYHRARDKEYFKGKL